MGWQLREGKKKSLKRFHYVRSPQILSALFTGISTYYKLYPLNRLFPDLRHLQPRHAQAHPLAANVLGAADQRHGRLLPHVEREVHAGYAAALCLLAEGDDAVGDLLVLCVLLPIFRAPIS